MDNQSPETLLRIEPISNTVSSLNNQDNPDYDYYNYLYASGVLEKLITSWGTITAETERQRDIRYVKNAASSDLRASGMLKADEMYSPVRLVDTNIRAEQPPSIAYITQSRRSIIFASCYGEKVDGLEKLEEDFTTKARYLGWELPFIRCDDGASAHGWDAVEILFDTDAPGNFVFEHIGHDALVFSPDCESLEAQEVICIRKNLTAKQLKLLIKDGFNPDQVDKMVNMSKRTGSPSTDDTCCETYKVFFKKDEIVHYAWYGRNLDGYLRDPAPLFLGVRDVSQPKQPTDSENPLSDVDYLPVYEKEFPVIIETYVINNDPKITEIPGRVKLDEASQEAASAIQSGMINGILRAANIYACPRERSIDSDPLANPKATDTTLFNGAIYDKPMDFFHTPYPEEAVIKALQAVITQNKQEQGGGVNFAVLNRKDSGKTATEINAAQQESTELTSVRVILKSIFLRISYAKAWRIYQNRVLQGALSIATPELLSLFGYDIIPEPTRINTLKVTQTSGPKQYVIKSSGDVDVIQRQERLNKLMQGWEVFGKTPLAMEYLKDIVRYAFPEDAARYVAVLEQAEMGEVNTLKQLLMRVSSVLLAFVQNPQQAIQELPQHAQELQQLQQQIQQALGAPSVQGGQGAQPQLPAPGQQQQPQQQAIA